MSLVFRLLLASFLLALSACSAPLPAERTENLREDQIVTADPAQTTDKVCQFKRVTGSQIPKMQCFSKAEIKRMEADAKARLRNASRGGSPRDH